MKLPKLPGDASDASAASAAKKPKSSWDTIVTSTPVVMTVLATILMGLSSSEMSQAQYFRSLSAQNQSKAGDQWGFFQAKKIRSASSAEELEVFQNTGDVAPLTKESFNVMARSLVRAREALGPLARPDSQFGDVSREEFRDFNVDLSLSPLRDPEVQAALGALMEGVPPAAELVPADPAVRKAYQVLKGGQGSSADPRVFWEVKAPALDAALAAAEENARAADAALAPIQSGVGKLQALMNGLARDAIAFRRGSPSTSASRPATSMATAPVASRFASASDRGVPTEVRQLAADFAAARLRFESARQEREAKVNQQTAYLYEIAVRKSSSESDRHRVRSQYFFFGMLAAQAAVTIATISLAVKERSWLWTLAATIGVMALSYAAYVYLFT